MNHHDVILAMRHPLVITHSECFDGFGSAWAAYQMFGDDAEYMPAKYGDQIPDVTGRDVLIADFSFKRDVMLSLNAQARSLVCLDHHVTAQSDLDGLDFALFDMNRSGAGITWDVLHGRNSRPPLIEYVEDRDLWRFALVDSKEINAWIGCVDFDFGAWDDLADSLRVIPREVATRGAAVLRKTDCYVRDMCKQARRIEFAGHADIPVVNCPYINCSELVGELAKTAPFAVGWFHNGAGMYQYSLRSRGEYDVSELAKRFGGGGHVGAAGFSSKTMVHQ
jgi:uncharacterized protein